MSLGMILKLNAGDTFKLLDYETYTYDLSAALAGSAKGLHPLTNFHRKEYRLKKAL